MTTETLDRLYLEWSNFTEARTARDLRNELRIQVLEAAIAPFVDVLENDIGTDETDGDFFTPMSRHNRAPRLTVGHFRQLRVAPVEDEA